MGSGIRNDPAPGGGASAKPAGKRGPSKSQSLTQKVYSILRSEIMTCELEPGRELSEAELASRFNVSKTPVREALATLRLEGFVRAFPRRGYQVVPITFGDLIELFSLRTILEAGAAELACARITGAEIEQLSKLADVVYDQSEQGSLKRFIRANRDFHAAIAKASGNERLHQVLVKLIDELERFFYLGAKLRNVNSETKDNHRAIVEVLRRRDPVEARQLMIRHNEITREGLLKALASGPGFGQISL